MVVIHDSRTRQPLFQFIRINVWPKHDPPPQTTKMEKNSLSQTIRPLPPPIRARPRLWAHLQTSAALFGIKWYYSTNIPAIGFLVCSYHIRIIWLPLNNFIYITSSKYYWDLYIIPPFHCKRCQCTVSLFGKC